MSEPTLADIERALRNADAAGDVEAARQLAAEYQRRSAGAPANPTASATPARAAGAPTGTPGELPNKGTLKTLVTEGIPQVGAQIAKGAVGLGMLPGEVARWGFNKLTGQDSRFGEGTEIAMDAIDSVVPPPKTKTGKVGVKTGAMVGTAAALPGTLIRNLLAQGLSEAGSAVGETAGAGVAGDNGRIIGGLIGGAAGGSPAFLRGGSGNHRQQLIEAMRDVAPGDLAAARRIQQEARQYGIDLTPEQLFPNPTGLDSLVSKTAQSGVDPTLTNRVAGQPQAALAAARNKGNQIGPRVDEADATRDLRLASEEALQAQQRTPANVRRLFDGDEARVSPQELEGLDGRLSRLQEAYRGSDETVAMIQGLRDRLGRVTDRQVLDMGTTETTRLQRQTGGAAKWKPVTESRPAQVEVNTGATVADTDLVVKSVEQLLKDIGIGTPAMERLMTGRVGGAVKEVKDALDGIVTTRPQGRELYRARKEEEERLASTVMGRLAGRKGVDEGAPDPQGLVAGTFGGDRLNERGITTLGQTLLERRRRIPDRDGQPTEEALRAGRAVPQGVRVMWERAVDKAFSNAGDARVPFGGARLADEMLGAPGSAKERNFRASMAAAANANGLDPQDFTRGMEGFLRVLKQTSNNRSGSMTPIPEATNRAGEIAKASAKTAAAGVVSKGWGFVTGARAMADQLGRAGREREMKKLADIFNDPDSLRLIEELGRAPFASQRAATTVQILLGATPEPTPEGAPR